MSASHPSGLSTVPLEHPHAEFLTHTIEHEIIPRLMLAHRGETHTPQGDPSPLLLQPEDEAAASALARQAVQPFARVLLEGDPATAMRFVETLRLRGVPLEILYLQLLAPVARYLGELWDQDLCDFTDVTVAAGRLQQLLRELSANGGQANASAGDGRRLLLLPAPKEQHTLGLLMVAEFFRRAGWEVSGGPLEQGYDPVQAVSRDWYDMVGFSLAASMHVGALTQAVAAVRRASRNAQVGIVLGGPVVMTHPALLEPVRADLLIADAAQAPDLVANFLSLRRQVN